MFAEVTKRTWTKITLSYCFVKKKQYFYHDLVIYVSENLTQIPSNRNLNNCF